MNKKLKKEIEELKNTVGKQSYIIKEMATCVQEGHHLVLSKIGDDTIMDPIHGYMCGGPYIIWECLRCEQKIKGEELADQEEKALQGFKRDNKETIDEVLNKIRNGTTETTEIEEIETEDDTINSRAEILDL
jgi:hypothetical protein